MHSSHDATHSFKHRCQQCPDSRQIDLRWTRRRSQTSSCPRSAEKSTDCYSTKPRYSFVPRFLLPMLRHFHPPLRPVDMDPTDTRRSKTTTGVLLCVHWFDFMTNAAVYAKTALLWVTDTIARRRLSFWGYVARQSSSIPAHCALACAIARRTDRCPLPDWKRPPADHTILGTCRSVMACPLQSYMNGRHSGFRHGQGTRSTRTA